ncbi:MULTISPECIES: hypothetical protein [Halorubrum]|nr:MULTISPECIES: hypothetical protein [Halorubrum]
MRHHFDRAKRVYEDRGLLDLAKAAVGYAPIEVNNAIFRMRHGTGTHVMDEDWDTLILLDACRYDMFEQRVPFDGRLESRISLGSTSEEFLRRNFEDSQFHDTVYVNANAFLPRVGLDQDGTFHAVVDLLDEWDDELDVSHPETVTQAAIKAHEQYPDKRVIVHYMQPHLPFIGEEGLKFREQLSRRNVWAPFRESNAPFSVDDLWTGYYENLEIVFEYTERLLDNIDGKVVISADHGNMVNERQGPLPTKRMFGHPWGVYTEQLVKVPWFVIETETRRTIVEDTPVSNQQQTEEFIDERLEALGYR